MVAHDAPLVKRAGSGAARGGALHTPAMFDFIVSIVVLAAFALLAGAFFLYRRGNTKQAVLMAVLAAVMVANVAIWLIPTADGESLSDAAASAEE